MPSAFCAGESAIAPQWPWTSQDLQETLARLAIANLARVPVVMPALPKGDRAVVTHAVVKPHVITYDPGGVLTEYVARYEVLLAQGNEVEIRGSCESACTLVTSVIPKAGLCFSDTAVLRFHKASIGGNPSTDATQWMVDSYPADIRSWIVAMGGVEQMPYESY